MPDARIHVMLPAAMIRQPTETSSTCPAQAAIPTAISRTRPTSRRKEASVQQQPPCYDRTLIRHPQRRHRMDHSAVPAHSHSHNKPTTRPYSPSSRRCSTRSSSMPRTSTRMRVRSSRRQSREHCRDTTRHCWGPRWPLAWSSRLEPLRSSNMCSRMRSL